MTNGNNWQGDTLSNRIEAYIEALCAHSERRAEKRATWSCGGRAPQRRDFGFTKEQHDEYNAREKAHSMSLGLGPDANWQEYSLWTHTLP